MAGPGRTGPPRECECDRWGCVTCMNRYLRNHYYNKRKRKGRRVIESPDDVTNAILDRLGYEERGVYVRTGRGHPLLTRG